MDETKRKLVPKFANLSGKFIDTAPIEMPKDFVGNALCNKLKSEN